MVPDKNSNIQTQHGNGHWWTKFITNRNISECSNRENILHFDFSFHLDTNGKINNQGNIYLPKGAICAKTIVLPPISWIANNRKLFPFLLSSIRNISEWHNHNFGKMVIFNKVTIMMWYLHIHSNLVHISNIYCNKIQAKDSKDISPQTFSWNYTFGTRFVRSEKRITIILL